MFIAIVTYLKPMEEIEKVLADHRRFLDGLLERGLLIASGPQSPRVGGVVMLRHMPREEAERLLADDPFCLTGSAEYRFIEFLPNKFAEGALPLMGGHVNG